MQATGEPIQDGTGEIQAGTGQIAEKEAPPPSVPRPKTAAMRRMLSAPKGPTCVCGLGFATGDIVLEFFDEGLNDLVSIHAYCWDDVDEEAEWFWDEGPASIGVNLANPADGVPKPSEYAVGLFKRALVHRDKDEVKKFKNVLSEALRAAEEIFFELHTQEINEGYYFPDDDFAEIDITTESLTKLREAAKEGKHHATFRAMADVDCHLCGARLASGDVTVLHAARKDWALHPEGVLSHAHCAVLRVNSTKNWTWLADDKKKKPMPKSFVWNEFVGFRTFIAVHVPLTLQEVEWRTKRHKKSLQRARDALSAYLDNRRERAFVLAREVRRESKILQGRDQNAKSKRES